MKAQVKIPSKLIPVFAGEADVRGAYGGRGSAKTRSFALMTAVRAYMWAAEGREGIILCGRQYMNTLDESSLEEVKAAIRSEEWLNEVFDIGEKYVRTKDGRVHYKFTGLDRNVGSVKSKSRILLCWVDEAEAVNDTAWTILIPTIREEDSELWVTWNPERDGSATDIRFRKTKDPRYKVVELNWRDNPRFPAKLERDRQRDLKDRPDEYGHIWEGEYKKAFVGSYYASSLTQAREENRICRVVADPLLRIRTYHDIGGSGNKADNYAIWVCQFVNREIRILDHYESQGQTLSFHVQWMRDHDYENALVFLPHDGVNSNNITGKRYQDHWEEAGFDVEVIPNQGPGAAMQRIEAGRRLFPRMWIDEEKCKAGLDALGWYHEKRDDNRNVGLGPCHDWASHSADAFGLMAIHYDEPKVSDNIEPNWGAPRNQGWMSA